MKFSPRVMILCALICCAAALDTRAQEGRPAAPNNSFPQWSHDGKKIVFTSDRDGDLELYVMNADGSNITRVTRAPGRDAHAYFSRDGRRIVFQSPRAGGVDTNVYVMDADGSNAVRLTNLKGFAGVPVYSPDEKSIVFQWRASNDFKDGAKWRICTMRADGSGLRVITPGEANDQVPNWSRDGRRLLFFSDRTGKNQLYTMKPDGSDVRRLTTTAYNDLAAVWSPDNRKIVFASDRDGNNELYVMNADGTDVRRLTNTRATEYGGVWSPDGGKIIFTAEEDDRSEMYVVNADGSNLMRLAGREQDKLAGELDAFLTRLNRDGYSGTALVARRGEILLHKGYGLADRERAVPNTTATLFNVASVGKLFTAAAVLQLETKGRLRTSDLVSKYLGPFPEEKSAVTIHHLLTHTGGLVRDGAQLDYSSRKAFVQSVKDTPAESRPGERYRYTNAGYTLLAAVVEEVSGLPFEVYLQKNVLGPAGLASTGFAWDTRFDKSAVAIGYEGKKPETLKPAPPQPDVWGARGPGNMITTVGDLYKWIQALRGNVVLSPEAGKKMLTAYVGDEAYGWHVTKTARRTALARKGGGRPDFESEVRWYMDEDVVVILTFNNHIGFRVPAAEGVEKIIWDGK